MSRVDESEDGKLGVGVVALWYAISGGGEKVPVLALPGTPPPPLLKPRASNHAYTMFVVIGAQPRGADRGPTSLYFVRVVRRAILRLDARRVHPVTIALDSALADWAQNRPVLLANKRLCAQLAFWHHVCIDSDSSEANIEYTLGMYYAGFGKTLLALLPARILDELYPLANGMERLTFIQTPLKLYGFLLGGVWWGKWRLLTRRGPAHAPQTCTRHHQFAHVCSCSHAH